MKTRLLKKVRNRFNIVKLGSGSCSYNIFDMKNDKYVRHNRSLNFTYRTAYMHCVKMLVGSCAYKRLLDRYYKKRGFITFNNRFFPWL